MANEMTGDEEQFVWVRRQWNDYRQANVRAVDLGGFHWNRVSGGVRVPAPQPFIHAYIWCDAIREGELAHSCLHGTGPHRIKVCVTKVDNKAAYSWLLERAGPKPTRAK